MQHVPSKERQTSKTTSGRAIAPIVQQAPSKERQTSKATSSRTSTSIVKHVPSIARQPLKWTFGRASTTSTWNYREGKEVVAISEDGTDSSSEELTDEEDELTDEGEFTDEEELTDDEIEFQYPDLPELAHRITRELDVPAEIETPGGCELQKDESAGTGRYLRSKLIRSLRKREHREGWSRAQLTLRADGKSRQILLALTSNGNVRVRPKARGSQGKNAKRGCDQCNVVHARCEGGKFPCNRCAGMLELPMLSKSTFLTRDRT